MNMATVLSLLGPLLFSIAWGTFVFTEGTVVMLTALLSCSLILPALFMENFKLFWPCGLLLILMSTGLIVIFAYIVSLHTSKSSYKNPLTLILYLGSSVLMVLLVYSTAGAAPTKINPFYSSKIPSVEVTLSLVLIFLLLLMVVNFIRIVYSKGGGFRKKF